MEAVVDSSMSLMARPVGVDVSRQPILCWRWFVDHLVMKGDMTQKSGDDYAARIYVGFTVPKSELSGGARFKLNIARALYNKALPDAALVYVWDNNHRVGTSRKSSHSALLQLIVAEGGNARVGSWVTERVDVSNDFTKSFPNLSGRVTVLAVAADGDDTKSTGRAAFADLHFVARDQPCQF